MELKEFRREVSRQRRLRRVFTVFYVAALITYLIVGLQPAEAHEYDISGSLIIPSVGLSSDVTELKLVNHKLDTPDKIIGSYSRSENKVFLIGHSSTVFAELHTAETGDAIFYNDEVYLILDMKTLRKEDIDMNEIVAPAEKKTIVIMTCAGESLGNKDASHRLIVTAEKM